jgi:nicotine blue oxidoreductase
MGRPKALLDWCGAPLAAAWVAALRPRSRRVVVVIGADADRLRAALPGLDLVENPAWETSGMLGSIRAGQAALGPGPVWITPVDVPVVAGDTLDRLAAHGGTAVPACGGRDGHPVLLDGATAARIPVARGTLRDLLRDADRVAVDDPAVAVDFDHPGEWAAWRG